MTSREQIMIRDWLNRFSDRWPEDFNHYHNTVENPKDFQVTILRKYINRANTDHDETLEILSLIHALKRSIHDTPITKVSKVRQTIHIEDISTGEL